MFKTINVSKIHRKWQILTEKFWVRAIISSILVALAVILIMNGMDIWSAIPEIADATQDRFQELLDKIGPFSWDSLTAAEELEFLGIHEEFMKHADLRGAALWNFFGAGVAGLGAFNFNPFKK